MSNKLIERINALILEQTEEPTKAQVAKAVNSVYAAKKKEAKSTEKKSSDGVRKKRTPSAYNNFMREEMAKLKESETGKEKEDCMSAKAKMQHVASLWAQKKETCNGADEFVEASEGDEVEEVEEVEEVVEVVKEPTPPPSPVAKKSNGKTGNGKTGNGKTGNGRTVNGKWRV
jgi:hypothetical protein